MYNVDTIVLPGCQNCLGLFLCVGGSQLTYTPLLVTLIIRTQSYLSMMVCMLNDLRGLSSFLRLSLVCFKMSFPRWPFGGRLRQGSGGNSSTSTFPNPQLRSLGLLKGEERLSVAPCMKSYKILTLSSSGCASAGWLDEVTEVRGSGVNLPFPAASLPLYPYPSQTGYTRPGIMNSLFPVSSFIAAA